MCTLVAVCIVLCGFHEEEYSIDLLLLLSALLTIDKKSNDWRELMMKV